MDSTSTGQALLPVRDDLINLRISLESVTLAGVKGSLFVQSFSLLSFNPLTSWKMSSCIIQSLTLCFKMKHSVH